MNTNYKENQAYYYEFILDEDLLFEKKSEFKSSNNKADDLKHYLDVIYQLKALEGKEKDNNFYMYLHKFINDTFNVNGIKLPHSGNRAFIVTKNEKNIEDCKEFCHYLAGNLPVLNLLIKHKNDKGVFESGLKTVYETLQLEKELGFNSGAVIKRAKL